MNASLAALCIPHRTQLEVRVATTMANRIAHLDRHNEPWKKFYNINFPAWLAGNRNDAGLFDASRWAPRASGLAGPVTLTPMRQRPQPE